MGNIQKYIEKSEEGDLKDFSATYDRFWVLLDRSQDDRVCGMVGLERLGDSDIGELRRMHLRDGGIRGRGLGGTMLSLLLQYAWTHDYNEIQLSTPEHNERSVHFYQKHGFKFWKRGQLGGDAYGTELFVWLRMHRPQEIIK